MDIKCDSTLRGCEENQHGQFLHDVIEAMLDVGGNEQHASSRNLPVFLRSFETRLAADHVIHLIFMMWSLRVGRPGRKYVKSRAHGRYAKKLLIQLVAMDSLPINLANIREHGLHARIPPNTSSVNCGARLLACS